MPQAASELAERDLGGRSRVTCRRQGAALPVAVDRLRGERGHDEQRQAEHEEHRPAEQRRDDVPRKGVLRRSRWLAAARASSTVKQQQDGEPGAEQDLQRPARMPQAELLPRDVAMPAPVIGV